MKVHVEGKERFMPPYWCVWKPETPDEENMETDEVDVNAILSLQSGDLTRAQVRPAKNSAPGFTVPVMTNTKALPAGTELLLQPATGQKEKAGKENSQRSETTWLDGAKKEFRKEFQEKK